MSESYIYVASPASARTTHHLVVRLTSLGNVVVARCPTKWAAEALVRDLRELKNRRDTERAYNHMLENTHGNVEPVQ